MKEGPLVIPISSAVFGAAQTSRVDRSNPQQILFHLASGRADSRDSLLRFAKPQPGGGVDRHRRRPGRRQRPAQLDGGDDACRASPDERQLVLAPKLRD